MAKMRVYDLAKELGIESKQIIETLNTTEYAVKAASSNIDDPAQDIVRKKFGKSAAAENTAKAQNKENVSESKPAENKTAAPENKPAQKPQANEQNKPAEGAKTENAEQRPKKKSSITAVFNAQYSKQGGGRGGNNNRRSGNGDRRQGNGDRRPQGQNPNRPGSLCRYLETAGSGGNPYTPDLYAGSKSSGRGRASCSGKSSRAEGTERGKTGSGRAEENG